jgi:hypothetical protein
VTGEGEGTEIGGVVNGEFVELIWTTEMGISDQYFPNHLTLKIDLSRR